LSDRGWLGYFFEVNCNQEPTVADEFKDSRLLAMAWNKKVFKARGGRKWEN